MNLEAIHRKAVRRTQMANEAWEEYHLAVREEIARKEAEAKSAPITVTEAARLLELSRQQVYTIGANTCKTYLDLWDWVKMNRPGDLRKIENNWRKR